MLRIGIVGCGNIFTMHATSAHHLKNAEIVAVCDIKKGRADKAAAKYGCKAYYDYKAMIRKDLLDVVHICVPHYLHPIISRYALEQGPAAKGPGSVCGKRETRTGNHNEL